MTTIVFTIVFGRIAQLPTDDLPPFLFYMAGNVVWAYFATVIGGTSSTFIANASIFGKVYFPRLAMPVALLISRMVGFGIQFVLFLGLGLYFWLSGAPVQPNAWVLLTPLLLLLMGGLGLGCGIIISALTTRYRDLAVLVTFGVQLLMYATPGGLPALGSARAVPPAGGGQPDRAAGRDLPLRLPRRRHGQPRPPGLQRRSHPDHPGARRGHVQPGRANVYGHRLNVERRA